MIQNISGFIILVSSDAISNMDYILQMAAIFENVYSFYIDTLGFSYSVNDPDSNHSL